MRLDLRVISASHRDLSDLVARGAFREDLFYRLNAATLRLPPLRERADLGWLVDSLVRATGRAVLDPEARQLLLAHGWPGNVRELVNAIELGNALASDGVIRVPDLPETISRRVAPVAPAASLCEEPEREALRGILAACGWNVSEAARKLGCDRTTVHRRMRRLGLSQPH